MLEKELLKKFDVSEVAISCKNCEFNFPNNGDSVCAGNNDTYGTTIEVCEKIYPNGCVNYKMSFELFCTINKKLENR